MLVQFDYSFPTSHGLIFHRNVWEILSALSALFNSNKYWLGICYGPDTALDFSNTMLNHEEAPSSHKELIVY